MKPKKAKKNEEVKMEEVEGKAENEENAVVPEGKEKRKKSSGSEDEKQEPAEKESFVKELLSWVYTIAIALFLGWFLSKVVLFNANVPTTSMESTIMKDDNLIGFRLAYKFQEPKRGDVVIFPYPDDPKINYVKRIIGMPGETVEIHDGGVYINGEILDETGYLKVTTEGDFGPFVCMPPAPWPMRCCVWGCRCAASKPAHRPGSMPAASTSRKWKCSRATSIPSLSALQHRTSPKTGQSAI